MAREVYAVLDVVNPDWGSETGNDRMRWMLQPNNPEYRDVVGESKWKLGK